MDQHYKTLFEFVLVCYAMVPQLLGYVYVAFYDIAPEHIKDVTMSILCWMVFFTFAVPLFLFVVPLLPGLLCLAAKALQQLCIEFFDFLEPPFPPFQSFPSVEPVQSLRIYPYFQPVDSIIDDRLHETLVEQLELPPADESIILPIL